MKPIYIDLHIHTSENPNNLDENYDLELLITKINEFSKDSEFLISLTDHNVINKVSVSYTHQMCIRDKAINEGIESGIAKDFDPKKHLESLKAKKRNG